MPLGFREFRDRQRQMKGTKSASELNQLELNIICHVKDLFFLGRCKRAYVVILQGVDSHKTPHKTSNVIAVWAAMRREIDVNNHNK